MKLNNKYKKDVEEKKKKKKGKNSKEKKNDINVENNNNENLFKNYLEHNLSIYNNISEKIFHEDNELVNLVYEKIKILKKYKCPFDENEGINSDENSKKFLNFSTLAKLCRTIIIYLNKFDKFNIEKSYIVNFSFELLFENSLSDNNEEIQDLLLNELINANKNVNYKN